jgi:hypothetical protein
MPRARARTERADALRCLSFGIHAWSRWSWELFVELLGVHALVLRASWLASYFLRIYPTAPCCLATHCSNRLLQSDASFHKDVFSGLYRWAFLNVNRTCTAPIEQIVVFAEYSCT